MLSSHSNTVFRYDRSFEGLLTSLFDAYARRTFPGALIGPGEPLPMFSTEIHEVTTDPAKAQRVWTGLGKKMPRPSRNMMLYGWLSELPGIDMLLMRFMRKVFDSAHQVALDFTDPDVLELKQIAFKVSCEGNRLRQFIRFQKGADGTYFAPVEPQFNSLPIAISYLTNRFHDQKWLVYDTKRRYGYYYDLKKAVEVTMEDDSHLLGGKLSPEMMHSDEKLLQQMWKSYFKHIAIKERINPKLHRQNMPRRYWKYMTEKQE